MIDLDVVGVLGQDPGADVAYADLGDAEGVRRQQDLVFELVLLEELFGHAADVLGVRTRGRSPEEGIGAGVHLDA